MKHCELDQYITFQTLTPTVDAGGGRSTVAANIGTDPNVWAKITPVRGSEGQTGGRYAAVSGYTFTILNRSDLDETMFILWNSRKYNIRAILYSGDNPHFLEIQTDLGAPI